LVSTRLGDIAHELYTSHARVGDPTHWNPVRPNTRTGRVRVYIGGGGRIVSVSPIGGTGDEWEAHIDTATGLPLTPNGSDITLTIDAQGLLHVTDYEVSYAWAR